MATGRTKPNSRPQTSSRFCERNVARRLRVVHAGSRSLSSSEPRLAPPWPAGPKKSPMHPSTRSDGQRLSADFGPPSLSSAAGIFFPPGNLTTGGSDANKHLGDGDTAVLLQPYRREHSHLSATVTP
jgi:hypothetical protein